MECVAEEGVETASMNIVALTCTGITGWSVEKRNMTAALVDVMSAEDSENSTDKMTEYPGGKPDPTSYLTGTLFNACKGCMHDDSDHDHSLKMSDTLVTLPYKVT